jgi:hypothetical protein
MNYKTGHESGQISPTLVLFMTSLINGSENKLIGIAQMPVSGRVEDWRAEFR